jgi:hypothetical protein
MINIFLKNKEIPDFIKDQLDLIQVQYCDFNDNITSGFIVCNKNIALDLKNIFKELKDIRFPIYSIIPISEFNWDDKESVINNNTSCFNYRVVIGSNKISDHATGNAIDINPFQNPWVHPSAHKIEGRIYNKKNKGTITKQVVDIFAKYGFGWGGVWRNPDYQHFFKSNK